MSPGPALVLNLTTTTEEGSPPPSLSPPLLPKETTMYQSHAEIDAATRTYLLEVSGEARVEDISLDAINDWFQMQEDIADQIDYARNGYFEGGC